MKKILSLVLSLALVLTAFTGVISVNANGADEPAVNSIKLEAGVSDTLTVDEANTSAKLFGDVDRYSYGMSAVTSLAETNSGVCAVKVHSNWRWSNSSDFYTEVVKAGSWVYSANGWDENTVPVISYNTSAGTKVSFKIVLRKEVASWEDVSVKVYYGNEEAYTPSASFLTYTEKEYSADVGTMSVRSYELTVPDNGKLEIALPAAVSVKNNTTTTGLNSDRDAFVHSSALLIPASASALPYLEAGVSDALTVDEANTSAKLFGDEDRYSYGMSAVTSLAETNSGVCAVKVHSNWRWSNSSDFYTEVVSAGNWVYSANGWDDNTVPVISYNTSAGTKVSFKIVLRKQVASWEDVSVKVYYGNEEAYTPSASFLTYTEKEYSADVGTMSVRSYELTVPDNGKLEITLPAAVNIKNNTKTTGLNSDRDAFVHSSALLIPASAVSSNISYIGVGDQDIVPDEVSGWKRPFSTKYGVSNGAAYVEKISLSDGWLWGNAGGNPSYLIPELTDNKVLKIDGNNKFSLSYNVKSGTTLVIPVVMKSIIWDALTDTDNLCFTVDDSTGIKNVTPEYIETSAKWSDSNTIRIVMRKYVIHCDKSSVVNITIPSATLSLMKTAAGTMNSDAAGYLAKGGAFVYPAYGLAKLESDVITNNGNGTNIQDELYLRANAASSEAFAYNDGITVSKVTTDWHWFISDTGFFDKVAAADSYVYSVANDRDITPQLYYAFYGAANVSFKVGMTAGVAAWNDVKVEYSADGSNWTPAEIRWLEDSFSTSRGTGTEFPLNVRFCEANVPGAGFLRISLPNGKTAADNWNTAINSNSQLLGYSLFVTGVVAQDGCFVVGDLNNDANIASADLVVLRKMLLNSEKIISADINSDHVIDIRDLVRLKRLLSNESISTFSLVTPSGGDLTVSTESTQFTWSNYNLADNYSIQIQKLNEETSSFENDTVINNIITTSYKLNEEAKLSTDSVYRWRVFACGDMNNILCNGSGKDKDGWNYFYTQYGADGSTANTGLDFTFDGSISKDVLCNYLSRSVTMTGEDNFLCYEDTSYEGIVRRRDILYSGAKYISRAAAVWDPSITEIENFDRQKNYIDSIHAYDPEIIFEACIFENVTSNVEQIPIPSWVFEAFGKTVETRNFDFEAMVSSGNTPDITKAETQMFFYYRACKYIDLGYEALHFGQILHIAGNDSNYQATTTVFNMIREYAKTHARRHFVLINAHTPYGTSSTNNRYDYVGTDNKTLFDFLAFPIRTTTEETESHAATEDNPQTQVLKVGNLDSIYNRAPGGTTHSGWTVDHLPYIVEFDNAGVEGTDHTAPTPDIALSWGKDDISWFASQPDNYRRYWLDYAYNWVNDLGEGGYLCMPLYRPATSADITLQGKYYVASLDYFAASNTAASDITCIKNIWRSSNTK